MRSFNIHNLIRLKRQSIVAVLCMTLSLIGFFELNAQNVYGWDKIYGPANGPDDAKAIVEMKDRGLVMVGTTNSLGLGNQIYTLRTDVDGTLLWTDTVGTGGEEFGMDVTLAADQNGVVVVGNGENLINGGKDVIFYQLDDEGNKLWTNHYSTNFDDEAFGITTTVDGGYAITGYTENATGEKDLFILKVDNVGDEEWVEYYGGDFDDAGHDIVQMANGNIVVTGYTEIAPGDRDIYVLRVNNVGAVNIEDSFGSGSGQFDEGNALVLDQDGNIFITGQIGNQGNAFLLRVENDGTFGGLSPFGNAGLFEAGNDIALGDDGNLVIVGFSEASAIDLNFFLAKRTPTGAPVWEKSIGQDPLTELGFAITKTYDGGFALAGSKGENAFSPTDVYLIRTNGDGLFLSNHVTGRAFRDANSDCNFQGSEEGVRNWIVEAKGVDRTFYGSVDANGNFDVLTDTGSYEVNIIIPNAYWNSITCQALDIPITVDQFDIVNIDYPVQTAITCPVMEVDVATSRIIPCADNVYRIEYCNQGTQIAVGATVDLILEKNLIYNSSTIPPVLVDDSLYVFAIGNFDIGECGFFEVNVTADCNTTIADEAHCVSASISPNDDCLADNPNWDGSQIRVDAYCEGDSVVFLMENVGTGQLMQTADFIVVEDIVMLQQPEPINNLMPGEVQRVAIKANGRHYRLVADQTPDHPGRNYFATASVEACDPDNQGISLGYVTQLEEADRDPYQSKDCIENQLSFDAIDFQGYPKGYKDTCSTNADLITSQTDLKYHIRFQNISTDTSKRVVIRDTIPSHLDITSIRPGASSHPYTFETYGDGFVKFTFTNLEQVNNTTDEMLSHGFVKYRISQKPNNPVGTIIENDAIVFQDYNVPTDTESSKHQVGGNSLLDFLCYLETSIANPNFPNVELEIYPNPFTEYATLKITGQEFNEDLELHLFDAAGKKVRTEIFDNNTLELYRHQLSQGLYVFTINVKGQVVRSGKLIIQ